MILDRPNTLMNALLRLYGATPVTTAPSTVPVELRMVQRRPLSQRSIAEETRNSQGRSLRMTGDLFPYDPKDAKIQISVGKYASIRRTFGPNDNAQALLICGGPSLARHSSFDPQYATARTWIRSHPVGPAVVGPILLQGLVGALIEAAIPQRVPIQANLTQLCPLIVGVEMEATVTVTQVDSIVDDTTNSTYTNLENDAMRNDTTSRLHTNGGGYQVQLRAECKRVRDNTVIAEGSQLIWIPDYYLV